ncbi:hypothetical protein GWG65_23075 [Bradyrhizobium sp. CSA207]|uniref:hypothetical protein n=1 Tax=Bradyrhizobium sp. CSA207 TaxID=2698826 RepID=UPI0023B01873|nr:hypothetical protein [Bradyrhizobium sp. CSA207]MDE5444279.1 hypothetical protein [Bradyrhizobium sp. CSA207]
MRFVKVAFAAILTAAGTMISVPESEAAPLPTNVGAMRAALDNDVVKVRYGGWGYRGGWGGGYRGAGLGYRGLSYRGVGYGYRGYGYRGYGYRGLGAGAAVVGGAIASSGYYGAYPYYDGGYASYGGEYGYDYCPPNTYSAYGSYGGYDGYYARRSYYSGW